MRHCDFRSLAVLMLMAIPAGSAQQQPPPPRAGTLSEGVHAVLVDVVVRDSKGQPVRDLTAVRLRGDRGRRPADDRIVHAGVREAPALREPATRRARRTGAGAGSQRHVQTADRS